MTATQTIARILSEDWDPIGVNDVPECQDEYDRYAPGVLALVQSGASAHAIAEHLVTIVNEEMGLPDRVTPDLIEVAEKIVRAGRP